jgi:RNA polymerase sigma factor (sigma-70 family)
MSLVRRAERRAAEPAALVKVEDHPLPATTTPEQRFRARYETLFDLLCEIARRGLRRKADAPDVVHDAMCGIWLHWDELEPQQPGVAFFVQAVKNQVRYHNRTERFNRLREKRFFSYLTWLSPRAPAPDAVFEGNQVAEVMEAGVASMSPRCQEVWRLLYEAGLTYEQAAEALELDVATIGRHNTRARKLVCKALERAGHPDAARTLEALSRQPVLEAPPARVTTLLPAPGPTLAAEDDAHE